MTDGMIPNPRQRPSWRWDLACECIKRGRGVDPTDFALSTAYTFLMERGSGMYDDWELRSRHPAMFVAHNVYVEADVRWFWEALIMASEPTPAIAEQFGTALEVVQLYEQLFFDVRDRLSQEGYVRAMILGPMCMVGSSYTDPDLTWKALGYDLGADVLREWWRQREMAKEASAHIEGAETSTRLKRSFAAWLNTNVPDSDAIKVMARIRLAKMRTETPHALDGGAGEDVPVDPAMRELVQRFQDAAARQSHFDTDQPADEAPPLKQISGVRALVANGVNLEGKEADE